MNEESTSQKRLTAVIIVAVILIICIFGGIYIMIHINNVKQEQLRASSRIEQLFDAVSNLSYDDCYESPVNLEKCADKLAESKELIDKNSLGEKYDKKYSELNSYLSDMKVFIDFESKYDSFDVGMAPNIEELNQKLGGITNEKVLKIAKKQFDFAEKAQEYIIAKKLYDMQCNMHNNNPNYTITRVFHYKCEKDDYIGFGLGVEEPHYTWRDFFDKICVIGTSIYNMKVITDIQNNGEYALCINYTDEEGEDMIRYDYYNAEVEAMVKDGGIRYKVTQYRGGTASTSDNLTFEQLKDVCSVS